MKKRIGFIGYGKMGEPICERLMGAGYDLVVFDAHAPALERAARAGAATAKSVRDLADRAETVVMCLPTPQIVDDVAIGPGGVVEGGAVRCLIDISTTGTRVARRIGERFAQAGKMFVDCPVTGGVDGAKSGRLSMISSGEKPALDFVADILSTIGDKVVVAGPHAGDGQMLKALNNMLSFVALEATTEVMVLGARYGLDPETMLDVFNAGTGRNSATTDKFPRSVIPRSFDFGFPVKGVNKDVGLCLVEAESLAVPMPVCSAVRQVWVSAMAEMGDEDMTSLVKMFERWAGVTVGGSKTNRL